MVNVSEFSYGYVVGQLVLAKSDGDDLDRLPDFLGQNAKVTFTRIQGQYVQPVKSVRSGIRALMVSHQPVVAGLMSDGTITGDVDSNAELKPNAKPGLWLVVGQYNVNFGDAFPSTTIEVKESHTEDDPLDIASAIGYKPAPNHVVTTVELPRGGEPGQVYGWTGTGIGWYTPPAGDSAYDLAVRNGFVGSEVEWVQSLKGDDGEPGHWTKDAQAKAQGYWIVVSPTEPESGTYTTADGTVVPVIWQKPIEVVVPVAPQEPFWGKGDTTITVAKLVGVDYKVAAFIKDGVSTPANVAIPEAQAFKLSTVSGAPKLPFSVQIEAVAEPGYRMLGQYRWTVMYLDPTGLSLMTSDGFSGADGTTIINRPTDVYAGGVAKTWLRINGGTTPSPVYAVKSNALAVEPSLGGTSFNEVFLNVGTDKQHVAFDLTWNVEGAKALDFIAGLRNLDNKTLGGTFFTFNSAAVVYRASGQNSNQPGYSAGSLGKIPNGRYILEVVDSTIAITAPGGSRQMFTTPDPGTSKGSYFYLRVNGNTGAAFTIDNLVINSVGV